MCWHSTTANTTTTPTTTTTTCKYVRISMCCVCVCLRLNELARTTETFILICSKVLQQEMLTSLIYKVSACSGNCCKWLTLIQLADGKTNSVAFTVCRSCWKSNLRRTISAAPTTVVICVFDNRRRRACETFVYFSLVFIKITN